ncbi:hypothetical protein VNO77_19712 [Canavalia gladiata]|uniref:Uncharacterized protein n=1 Tax=Canavalia gladiata TaxID=3824 RepID=A0AAN9LRF2_CANGL
MLGESGHSHRFTNFSLTRSSHDRERYRLMRRRIRLVSGWTSSSRSEACWLHSALEVARHQGRAGFPPWLVQLRMAAPGSPFHGREQPTQAAECRYPVLLGHDAYRLTGEVLFVFTSWMPSVGKGGTRLHDGVLHGGLNAYEAECVAQSSCMCCLSVPQWKAEPEVQGSNDEVDPLRLDTTDNGLPHRPVYTPPYPDSFAAPPIDTIARLNRSAGTKLNVSSDDGIETPDSGAPRLRSLESSSKKSRLPFSF